MSEATPVGNVVAEPQAAEPVSAVSEVLLLYDGLCGFCDRTVRFVLSHDRIGTMRFAPLQGTTAAAVLERHPGLQGVDSLVLVRGRPPDCETASVRSEAILGITVYLGGVWRLAAIARIVPRPLRDWAYARFARMRYRLFGRYDRCPIPPAKVRDRFLP